MTKTAPIPVHQTALADAIRRGSELIRVATQGAWPVLDLIIRGWLAEAFFISGLLKASDWETALLLARDEYPVPWMDPISAAYIGVSIELIAPVLLAFGLGTRIGALTLLLLTLVAEHYYL
ncbi:MAG: DoxX family protein, partial [Thiohalocapsa sp.]